MNGRSRCPDRSADISIEKYRKETKPDAALRKCLRQSLGSSPSAQQKPAQTRLRFGRIPFPSGSQASGSLPGGTDEFRASDINCVRLFNFMTLYHVPSGLSRPFCNFLYQILHFCENRTVRQVKARRSLSNPSKTRARGQAMFMRRKVSPPRPYWLPFDKSSPVRSRISRASATESSV